MIKSERMEQILDILKIKKHASVESLSKQVFVSPVTIRRDLRQMEQQGLVKRSYGGASLIDYENKVVPLHLREEDMRSEKAMIAKQAVTRIREGDTVFLDASSTVLRMTDYIPPKMRITVVTNSIKVVAALCEKDIAVYCIGGKLINSSLACVGPHAIQNVQSLNADVMFFSSQGLSACGDITDFSESETHLRQTMLARAGKKIFLCDSGKLGKSFLFTICNARDVDEVLSDKPIPESVFSSSGSF
ncbi:DeoR/GlpR family DNA-binding transcription regulator [Ruminococcaceae bacterium OttesenSCG-928-L11]|nr:DeoR/GlpR family DNA-binding transcription regulator [Ruminococcaceae bacterium OttesenSCG-928-L11]